MCTIWATESKFKGKWIIVVLQVFSKLHTFQRKEMKHPILYIHHIFSGTTEQIELNVREPFLCCSTGILWRSSWAADARQRNMMTYVFCKMLDSWALTRLQFTSLFSSYWADTIFGFDLRAMHCPSSGVVESRVCDACSVPLLQSGFKGNLTSIE